MTDLQALPVEELKHVGLQSAAILRAKGILTVGDLLSRLPRRYVDLRTANDWNLVVEKVIGATVAVEKAKGRWWAIVRIPLLDLSSLVGER